MLLTLGLSHKTAPVEIREKLAFSQESIPMALKTLIQDVQLEEVALLSTCNRTEFYCSTHSSFLTQQAFISWWHQYQTLNFDMKPYLYFLSNENAVKHMMRVAGGLDSMIIGEPQILGQLKTAYKIADQIGAVGKKLSRLFQTSFTVAKEIRTQTEIASHPVSVAFAAVTLAKQIFANLTQTRVVLIGAGKNVELILQHLLAKKVKEIIIVNRTLNHATILADRYNTKACSLSDLSRCLTEADVVISSIASPFPVLTQAHLNFAFQKAKRRPFLLIDLGVPRNIESQLALNEDVFLYTIDDLQGVITQNLDCRQKAATDAENIVHKAMQDYMHWVDSEHRMQIVRTLRIKSEKIKNEVMQIALQQLEKGICPKKVVEHLTHRLTQKLMHDPTSHLRKMRHDAKEKIELAKELFSIE